MGAEEFISTGIGKTVKEAFDNARSNALAENGHQEGYSGTVYAKNEYYLVFPSVTATDVARAKITEVMESDDHPVNAKYGPAGAIRLADTKDGLQRWVFFGLAPS